MFSFASQAIIDTKMFKRKKQTMKYTSIGHVWNKKIISRKMVYFYFKNVVKQHHEIISDIFIYIMINQFCVSSIFKLNLPVGCFLCSDMNCFHSVFGFYCCLVYSSANVFSSAFLSCIPAISCSPFLSYSVPIFATKVKG